MNTQRDEYLTRARFLARYLDRYFLDPLIGLVLPGAGDLITGAAGLYIVYAAIQLGLPAVVIARMLLNLALDTALGAIPLAGDVFDLLYRANQKNLQLLESRASTRPSAPGDYVVVGLAALIFVAALSLPALALLVLAYHSL